MAISDQETLLMPTMEKFDSNSREIKCLFAGLGFGLLLIALCGMALVTGW